VNVFEVVPRVYDSHWELLQTGIPHQHLDGSHHMYDGRPSIAEDLVVLVLMFSPKRLEGK
jgi:hypothetical protein